MIKVRDLNPISQKFVPVELVLSIENQKDLDALLKAVGQSPSSTGEALYDHLKSKGAGV